MNREESLRFYTYIVKACVLIALFSPLVLSSALYFPFIVAKTIFFQIAVEIALFFYILLAVLDKKYAPKFDGITKSVCVFFGVYVIASLLGADPVRSFFGTYERMLGVINLTHFIALFFIIKAVFTTQKNWLILLRTFLGVSVLLSLYGILQKMGVTWSFIYHANIDRVDATIGNAAFVAGYLIFALFFALLILAKDTNIYSRSFAIFSIILNTVTIYFTGTRGAVLALGVGGVVLGIVYLFKKDTPFSTKKKTILTVGGIAISILIAVFIFAGKEGALQYYKRFTSISITDTTVRTRILAAQSSWHGFMARPFLGWGPENYNLVFDKYYNPKIYPSENWFDHAHNIFFDIATTMGIVGVLAYFFLIGHVWWKGISLMKNNKEEYWTGTLISTLILVYVIQNIFVFDSLVTYLSFMIVLAFVSAGFPLRETSSLKQKEEREKRFYNPTPRIAVILLPIFVIGIYTINIRPLLGSYWTVQSLKTKGISADEVITNFSTAIDYSNFGRHEIRGKLADYTADFIYDKNNTNEDDKKKLATYTMNEMEKTVQDVPLDFRNYLYMANFLGQASDILAKTNVNALQKADELLKKAQELGPDKQILYLQWVKVKFSMGDFEGAIPLLEKLSQLSPDMTETQTKLAYIYTKLGDNDKARAMYHALITKGGLSVQDYIDIAVGLSAIGDKQGAISVVHTIVEIDPSLKEKADNFIASLK